ncbi:hypothetical protein C1886_09585 [Pseudomonas sp. FW300-N1A1]|nr:hypothetical protein C1886_09585 [Pseudomonas sp. FW300-N1A1]
MFCLRTQAALFQDLKVGLVQLNIIRHFCTPGQTLSSDESGETLDHFDNSAHEQSVGFKFITQMIYIIR